MPLTISSTSKPLTFGCPKFMISVFGESMFIRCSDISFRYPGSEHLLVQDLSFVMENPGFNALFGPSGVGKTSLAKMISKDIGGYGGNIHMDGIEKILYSYNLERLPGWSSVGAHLKKVTPPETEVLREELIDVFGLRGSIESRFSQLSMGQQNRINLIRYLLQDFDLLIMDESLANVDEASREKIILKIKQLFPSKLFLYISHNLVEVSKYCNQILVFGAAGGTTGAKIVAGQDFRLGKSMDKGELDRTMLEVMNAS